MARVIVTDHVFGSLDDTRAVLEPLGVEVVLAARSDEDALVELCADRVDGLLVCFAQVSSRVVQAAADAGCRIIARYGIGYDNVAVDTATANGIVVTRVPDYCLDEVADHALALLLNAARADSLDEALAEADIVSLHVPLTDENRGLIGERANCAMHRRPMVVNTARGGLVDLDAATAALDDGRLSALALDVVDPEPLPPEHPLRTHARAIITPHMAFFSAEAEQELQRRAAGEVAHALRGEPVDVPVNPEVVGAGA
jgi:D-3-phosphoglycerate dehydrogenase